MKLQNRTRYLIASELEAMLTDMPFEKVRVTELARRVGISPQNFYYHFRDKYELVAWIIVTDVGDILRADSGQFSETDIEKTTLKMAQRRGLYQKMFADSTQSFIETYIHRFNTAMAETACRTHFKTQQLTAQQKLAVDYHFYGVEGVFRSWILGNLDTDVAEISAFFFERAPGFLKEAYSHQLVRAYNTARRR